MRYRLQVRLASPLAISADRNQSNETATLSHVPPTALRGGVAAFMLRFADKNDPNFLGAFGEEGLRPSALLPVTPRNGAAVNARTAPLTLLSCKRYPGFLGEDDGEKNPAHGVEDSLFATLAYVVADETAALDALQKCPRCPREMVLQPYRRVIGAGAGGYATQPEPGTRVQTHVGLDRRRAGAAAGILYSREVINEQPKEVVNEQPENEDDKQAPDRFEATLRGKPETLGWLAERLKPGAMLNLGNAISRGLGRCVVEKFEALEEEDSLPERVEQFSKAAAAYVPAFAGHTVVSLTLETPALFVDAFLRPLLSPGAGDLLQAADPEEATHAEALRSMALRHQVARPYRFAAWNGLTHFPHATDQGLAAGSVLVFATPTPDDGLHDALAHLEEAGIGLRRALGFGAVRVCDPLHVALHQLTNKVAADA